MYGYIWKQKQANNNNYDSSNHHGPPQQHFENDEIYWTISTYNEYLTYNGNTKES